MWDFGGSLCLFSFCLLLFVNMGQGGATPAPPKFLHVRFMHERSGKPLLGQVSKLLNTPKDIYQTISQAAIQFCYQHGDNGSALIIQDAGKCIVLRPQFPYEALPSSTEVPLQALPCACWVSACDGQDACV